jgi:hypothetical protein
VFWGWSPFSPASSPAAARIRHLGRSVDAVRHVSRPMGRIGLPRHSRPRHRQHAWRPRRRRHLGSSSPRQRWPAVSRRRRRGRRHRSGPAQRRQTPGWAAPFGVPADQPSVGETANHETPQRDDRDVVARPWPSIARSHRRRTPDGPGPGGLGRASHGPACAPRRARHRSTAAK